MSFPPESDPEPRSECEWSLKRGDSREHQEEEAAMGRSVLWVTATQSSQGAPAECRPHLRVVPPEGRGARAFVLRLLASLAEDCSRESQLSWHLGPALWKVAFAPTVRESPQASRRFSRQEAASLQGNPERSVHASRALAASAALSTGPGSRRR